MRLAFFLLLLGGLLLDVEALGRLIQPDGSTVALGQNDQGGVTTLLLGAGVVPKRSWLLLPPGASVREVELVTPGERRRLSFPVVRIPGLRYAFEVPARLLSVSLQGRLPSNLVLTRSTTPPPRDAWVVRSRSELRVDLPSWKTAEGWTPFLQLTRANEAPWQVHVTDGNRSRGFSLLGNVQKWNYWPHAWGLRPTSLVVRSSDPRLSEVAVRAAPAEADLVSDPATLLAWPAESWRNPTREWFHWAGTEVLVLVSGDYRVQDQYLKRLAFFVEKEGYRGRLVTEAEVAHLHAWNAHDYAAPDLARFYNRAQELNFPLNPSERELLDRLVAAGVLEKASEATWKAGRGALVGISAESAPALRSVLFVHEAFHGLYFTRPEFRAEVRRIWDGLTEASRELFRAYLSRSRYDPSDEGLMVNEFQAYVLQRPASEWEGFFRQRVLGGSESARFQAALIEYRAAARELDAVVRNLFGFPSGDVFVVTSASGT